MKYDFSTIHERDMDMLFLEAIGTDRSFADLFVSKTKWAGKEYTVEKIQLSKTDAELGESDITVTINIGGNKYALLIEDKVDAIDMPDQHERYVKRGKASVKAGEYEDFEVFITCSKKYYDSNTEAKLYEHCVLYEECLSYFETKDDELSKMRAAQFDAAIKRAKKPYEANIDESAYLFFSHYREYQKNHYPMLDLRTKQSSNGWWPQYGSKLGNTLIYHKMQEGFVDLTFPNAAEHMDTMQRIASWLRDNGNDQVLAVRTGKSCALRIECPKLKVKNAFTETSENDLKICFDAISRLTLIASIFTDADRMSRLKK